MNDLESSPGVTIEALDYPKMQEVRFKPGGGGGGGEWGGADYLKTQETCNEFMHIEPLSLTLFVPEHFKP